MEEAESLETALRTVAVSSGGDEWEQDIASSDAATAAAMTAGRLPRGRDRFAETVVRFTLTTLLTGIESRRDVLDFASAARGSQNICCRAICCKGLGSESVAVPDDLERAFGDAIRRLREQRGMSQEALSFACGRHRTYVSLIERGKNSPSIRTVFMLAEALDTNPSELLTIVEDNLRQQSA